MPPGHGPSNRFPKCTEGGKIVELARPIELAIVGHGTSNDHGTPVVVEGGTNRGIDKTWRATLLDANQREMADARIAGLEPDAIEVLAPMAAERIDNFARSVRFTPPENTRLVIPTAQPKVEPISRRPTGQRRPAHRLGRPAVHHGLLVAHQLSWRCR